MLFITTKKSLSSATDSQTNVDNSSSASSKPSFMLVKQDPVDDFLEKQKGTITRKRDPILYVINTRIIFLIFHSYAIALNLSKVAIMERLSCAIIVCH